MYPIKTRFFACFLAFLASLVIAASASAALEVYDVESNFNTDINVKGLGPTVSQDFDGFSSDTPFHTTSVNVGIGLAQMTVSLETDPMVSPSMGPNVNTVDTGELGLGQPLNGTPYLSMTLLSRGDGTAGDSLVLQFDRPISAFGAMFREVNDPIDGSNDPRSVFFIDGVSVTGSPVVDDPSMDSPRFIGFIDDMNPFDEVRIQATNADETFAIDDVLIATGEANLIPVPAALPAGLVAIGLAAWWRRRRTHQQVA
jgi:hypothetical protein